ncbi:hypothetical protein BDA99DRAFT_543927 [Phascolomyces articulosus]|uniref:Uncharacterized protein n=1 Tax=Phascolomyces articulosus TaxID=60185 RepID=A0AAD5JMD4_9FUNG|nr:hypothetical protein BDA99DRAFT_543927 [Phascolomyces articulosus]
MPISDSIHTPTDTELSPYSPVLANGTDALSYKPRLIDFCGYEGEDFRYFRDTLDSFFALHNTRNTARQASIINAQVKKYARIFLQGKIRATPSIGTKYDELIKLLEEEYDAFEQLTQGEDEPPRMFLGRIQQAADLAEINSRGGEALIQAKFKSGLLPRIKKHCYIMGSDNPTTITLVDILSSCNTLSNLSYSANVPMNSQVTGDISILKQQRQTTLITVQLYLKAITGDAIEGIIQQCQQLRRLVMSGCDHSVLDKINMDTTNIKVLICNASEQHISKLLLLDDSKKVGCDSMHGLQLCYLDSGTRASMSQESVIPFLYNDRRTIEVLHTDIQLSNEDQLLSDTTYPDFLFDSVKHLSFYAFTHVTIFLSQSIRYTAALTRLHVRQVYSIRVLTDFILNREIYPIELFFDTMEESEEDLNHCIRLFVYYAKLSKNPTNVMSLQRITLHECFKINDKAIISLGCVATLINADLCVLPHITSNGFMKFLNCLPIHNKLQYIRFSKLDSVTDQVIHVLRLFDNLICVKLGAYRKLQIVEYEI